MYDYTQGACADGEARTLTVSWRTTYGWRVPMVVTDFEEILHLQRFYVFVDGRRCGRVTNGMAPLTIPLSPGAHEVWVSNAISPLKFGLIHIPADERSYRAWIRLRTKMMYKFDILAVPVGDPFAQTLLTHFENMFADPRATELIQMRENAGKSVDIRVHPDHFSVVFRPRRATRLAEMLMGETEVKTYYREINFDAPAPDQVPETYWECLELLMVDQVLRTGRYTLNDAGFFVLA